MTSSPPDMEKLAGELNRELDRGKRPTGSNADEWHLFLSEHLDTRANFPYAMSYVAVQIAEAIDTAALRTPSPALDARTVEDNSVNREIAMDQILTLSRELGAATERLMRSEKAYRALERKSAKERRKLESEVFIANSPIRENREG